MTLSNTTIHCSKSALVQELLYLQNLPYSLADRQPMITLYDLEETDVLLMMGRQYGKSTFLASDALVNCAVRQFFKTLYVSPRQDQTSEFSTSKLEPFIAYSKPFRSLCMTEGGTQNVYKKTFDRGCEITLKYAYHTADAIRGISSDHVLIDEIQDVILGNIPVIEECLSGSKYQWRTYAGTPKTLNNTLAQKWAQSTQCEWVIKCSSCNKWNIIDMRNILPLGLGCKKCGKVFPKDAPGKWIAKKQYGPGVYLSGFRIPQVVSPTVQWPRIIEKLNNYSVAKFMNEVLALPYDNSANPLSEAELKAVCIPGHKNSFEMTPDIAGSHLFLGVDWGNGTLSLKAARGEQPTGFTVAALGRYDWDGKFQLLGLKKFTGQESDPLFQVSWIQQTAQRLGVAAVGVDFGNGFMQNAQLKQMFGTDRLIEWQASDSLRVNARWVPEANRMQYNRSEVMTDRLVEIKNQKVKFFCFEDFREFSPDFLTICIDMRDNNRTIFYNHTLPDDAFHAYLYAKSTADYVLSR